MNYLDFFKKGGKSGIYIKKKNRGKFTKSAKAAGEGVQEHAHKVMNDPNATPLQKKRANFAIQAKRWAKKHQSGGELINKNKKILFSRAKVETPEQKYTMYIPEDNTSNTYVVPREAYKENYDLSGYTIPSLTVAPTVEKSDNKLHADLNGLLSLFNKYNVRVRVTSGYREGAKTKQGKTSFHALGKAIDIVPEDGDFAKLAQTIKTNPEIKSYMMARGLGVYDETSAETLALTGGTAAHYHIGPDKIAQKFWTT